MSTKEKVVHQAPVEVGGYTVRSAKFVKAAVSLKGLPEEHLPQIAKLVKISSTPGKTRELNFFKVNDEFFLVDLPGVGFAKVNNAKRDQMSDFIREYVEKCKDLKGLIYLVDIRHGGTPIDIETVESIRATGCPVLVVASKRDKVNQSELAKGLRDIQQRLDLDQKPLCVSSLKKTGLDELWTEILEAIHSDNGKDAT